MFLKSDTNSLFDNFFMEKINNTNVKEIMRQRSIKRRGRKEKFCKEKKAVKKSPVVPQ
jgi:hypothetical protein